MDITNLVTTDWQISVTDLGDLAQGAADISQCLLAIFATQKGSDPFDPAFGVDLLKYQDKPVTDLAPALMGELIEQVAAYETRVILQSINYTITIDGQVLFALIWAYTDETLANISTAINSASSGNNTTYFLLADNHGVVLLSDAQVALIIGQK